MQTSSSLVSDNQSRFGALGSIVLGMWAIAIVVIVGRAIVAPHQNTVFIVFRDAGRQWLSGTDLYSHVGKYLYSPLAAAIFSPFSLLPDAAGAALWRLLIIGLYLSAIVVCFRRLGQRTTANDNERQRTTANDSKRQRTSAGDSERQRSLFFSIAGLLLLPLSIGNMNNGQASLLVIGLILFACAAIETQSWTLAAFLIALATFFKIYPLVIGLLFAVIYPRPLALRLLLAIVALWLFSLLLQNPRYVLQQYQNWFLCLRADQRRVSGELGRWRDFWLLLRIARIPITTSIYALIQILAGGLVAAGCWWMCRVALWDNRRIIWTAFTFGCLWITLFGPSTEQATYVFLAPSFAMAGAWIWTTDQRRWLPFVVVRCRSLNLGGYCVWFTASYSLLMAADALNAWVPAIRQNNYLHALEPIAALVFAALILAWSMREERSASVRPVFESR
jgi:Glycosyltransferase family 87